MFFDMLVLLVAMTTTSALGPFFRTSGVFQYDSNKALIGYVIKTLNNTIEPDCITACEETAACFSINVHTAENTCELNRSNKKQNLQALVSKTGYKYGEPDREIKFCIKNKCQVKQILPGDWYKIGESSFKFVPEKKSRTDSREHCQALGGDLATITNQLENNYVSGLLTLPPNTLNRLGILKSVVMDGKDTPFSLHNGASIVKEDNVPALHLDGIDDYADIPRFETRNTDFTMAVWIKTEDADIYQYLFHDYDGPNDLKSFRLYIYTREVRLRLYFPSTTFYCYSQGTIPGNVWIHLAITWKIDHTSCKIYFDGRLDVDNPGTYSTEALRVTPNPVYMFGKKRSNERFFKGWMRHFFFFSRLLTLNEIIEVKDLFESDAWIGLNDVITEGTMQWADGTPLTFLPGSQSDLSNAADKDCAMMSIDGAGEWKMKDCATHASFICKK